MSQDRWNEAGAEEISTSEFDKVIKEMDAKWLEVEETKKVASSVREEYDAIENKLLDMLKRAKKSKYIAEGLGTVSIKNTYQVTTPKTLDAKQRLFNWIRGRDGDDGLMAMLSINSQRLNAWTNELKTQDPLIEIPGLDQPTHRETISFRAVKK